MVKKESTPRKSNKNSNTPQKPDDMQRFGKRHLNSDKVGEKLTDLQGNKNLIDINYSNTKNLPIYDAILYKVIITNQEVLLDTNKAWLENEKLDQICKIKGDIAKCYDVKPELVIYCQKDEHSEVNGYLFEGFLVKGQMEGYARQWKKCFQAKKHFAKMKPEDSHYEIRQIYCGILRINQKHGENCRYYGPNGRSSKVEGGFDMDQQKGFCKIFNTWDGDDLIFEGFYNLDKKHGHGKEYDYKGDVIYEGKYIEGFTEAEYQRRFPDNILKADLFYTPKKQKDETLIYIDGAFDNDGFINKVNYSYTPRKNGGWGYFIDDKNAEIKNKDKWGWGPIEPPTLSKDESLYSETRCEIIAAIEALKRANDMKLIKIYTDCQNLVNAFKYGTVIAWQKSDYSDEFVYDYGRPREKFNNHKELWCELLEQIKDHDKRFYSKSKDKTIEFENKIEWRWIQNKDFLDDIASPNRHKHQGLNITDRMSYNGIWLARNHKSYGEFGKDVGRVHGAMINNYGKMKEKATAKKMYK